jgi:aarF domain-containing kinase
MRKQIPREFDFHRERAMMEFIGSSIGRNFKDVYVPTVLPAASSSKTITMTYMQGVSLAKFIQDRSSIQRTSLSTFAYNLIAVFGYQIFEIGTFHSDPHPGNILLQENGSFTLLDFGQVKVLSDNVRIGMAQLVVALSYDSSYVSDCFKHLGLKVEGATENLIEIVAYVIFDTRMDIPEANMNPFDDSIPHEMRSIKISTIPQEVFMLIRIIALLRGILSSIGIDIHSREIWLPYAQSFLNRRKIRTLAKKNSSEKVAQKRFTQNHGGMEQIARWMAQQGVRSSKERLKHLALANIWSMKDFAEFLSTGNDDQIHRVLRGFSLDERDTIRRNMVKWPAT